MCYYVPITTMEGVGGTCEIQTHALIGYEPSVFGR